MSSTLSIIANPHSHRNRLWPLAAEALRKAAPGAPILETGTAEELRQALRKIAHDRPSVLAIAGGDGTVQHTLTALRSVLGDDLPRLALLGGGALDSLANGLGGSGDPEDRLRRIAEALHAGVELQHDERDTLCVAEQGKSPLEGRLGFRMGAGLPQRFLEALAATGRPSPARGALLAASALCSSVVRGPLAQRLYQELPVSVALDGDEWPRVPLFGLLCASVAEAGLGLRPFRRAVEQPGFFQVLGLTGSQRQFAAELPRMLIGLPARRDRLLDGVAERLEVRGKPFRWFLDGEMHDSQGALAVTVGPRVQLVRA